MPDGLSRARYPDARLQSDSSFKGFRKLSPQFCYSVYGISLNSEIPLDLPAYRGGEFSRIELRVGTRDLFLSTIANTELVDLESWYQYAHLNDGSSYVRWHGLGEFLVAAGGKCIWCMRAPEALAESFQVYLLGQALSFALVKAGLEPLHGTAIEHEGEAIAMLGSSGFGKSTLAAGFVAAGCRLLTDDQLVLRSYPSGLRAYPGPPRIKLLPDSASRVLGPTAAGVPMNAQTNKHVIALGAAQHCQSAVPLRLIYVLATPSETRRLRRVRAVALSARDAFFALVGNTYNRYIIDPDRLKRQMPQITHLVSTVPVRKLFYPRSFSHLGEVCAAILADSRRHPGDAP